MRKVLRIGHRGACGYAPENTLASFRAALALNVDMIEMDVRLCRSGEAVVIHDARLERTTNGTGYVREKTLRALRRLDAGRGERIPLLTEALACIDGKTRANIELKDATAVKPAAAAIIACMRTGRWTPGGFLVSSFDHYALQQFHALIPVVALGALVYGVPLGYARDAAGLKPESVNLDARFVTRDFIRDAHNRGMRVYVYTADDPGEIRRLRRLGVDGIFSNYPDRV
jgi:glycerophosphoryl diester phosphodiesterase